MCTALRISVSAAASARPFTRRCCNPSPPAVPTIRRSGPTISTSLLVAVGAVVSGVPGLVGGLGGHGGYWNQQRLTKSQISGAAFTVTIGGGGGPAGPGGSAHSGGTTSVVVPGWDTLYAYGGPGGVGNYGVGAAYGGPGFGPGNDSFPDYYGDPNVYYGGAQQNHAQYTGNQPGGGGAGGNASVAVGTYIGGGAGAAGAAFILAYQ